MAADVTEDATALPGDKPERPSAVLAMVNSALARLRADDPALTNIAELERRRGLPKGALASPLKPTNLGRVPRQPTIRTMAAALNLNPAELGQAFMVDYMGDGDEKTVHQQRAADLIGELSTPLQRLGIRQLELLVDHHRACEAATLSPGANESAASS
ncbi:hypothetical protein [Lentzea aerocolonigenes]|nr:hypothetical protein [Lentzea aerocolonigenes]